MESAPACNVRPVREGSTAAGSHRVVSFAPGSPERLFPTTGRRPLMKRTCPAHRFPFEQGPTADIEPRVNTKSPPRDLQSRSGRTVHTLYSVGYKHRATKLGARSPPGVGRRVWPTPEIGSDLRRGDVPAGGRNHIRSGNDGADSSCERWTAVGRFSPRSGAFRGPTTTQRRTSARRRPARAKRDRRVMPGGPPGPVQPRGHTGYAPVTYRRSRVVSCWARPTISLTPSPIETMPMSSSRSLTTGR